MTTSDVPSGLRVQGQPHPLGVDDPRPVLSWSLDDDVAACEVAVHHDGDLIWTSPPVPPDEREIRYGGPSLRSRAEYTWRVRVRADPTSPWSEPGRWEMGLLAGDDWSARWISRPVPAAQRTARATTSETVTWATAGDGLGQRFTATGPITGVNLDLASPPDGPATVVIRLLSASGETVAERTIVHNIQPWEWFGAFLDLTLAPAPAGRYEVHVEVTDGRAGWWGSSDVPATGADDGVSPRPLLGPATTGPAGNTSDAPGTRSVGVETAPAANPLFRTTFGAGNVIRARLYAAGLGYASFLLNGTPVSEAVLEPAQTDYAATVLYRTYDVGALLRDGENTLEIRTGRGFYAARGANTWGWNLAPWHREPAVLAQLELEHPDRTTSVVASDRTWQTAAGPIVSDILYQGVTFDARASVTSWTPAPEVAAPGGTLRAAVQPPILRAAELAPEAEHEVGAGVRTLDFGRTLAGWVRLTLSATEPGASVEVAYGEYVDDDGRVVCRNPLAAGTAQRDLYLAAGDEDGRVWEPEFSYKGFRYVTLTITGGLRVEEVQAVPLRAAVAQVGEFACSDDTLTWLDAATSRTFLNNLHGIPTDTPVYEKNGWTADAHLITEAALHHSDLRYAFGKWMNDHADAQEPSGSVPQIVPSPGWGRRLDPAWSGSTVLIAWDLYQEYGDLDELRARAPMMRAYTDAALTIAEHAGWLWPLHSWGDWLAPGYMFSPEGPVPTATLALAHIVDRMVDVSRTLDDTAGVRRYTEAFTRLATAYHAEFFDTSTGTYRSTEGAGYRQSMNVLPLAFGTVSEADTARVVAGLVGNLADTGGHLNCGALTAKHLLPVLSTHGRDDLALTVATQPTRPGWDVWRTSGSDTLFESWDANARSHNHYFLGAAAWWLHRRVAGLVPTAPGWRRARFDPLRDSRVTWARTRHRTARGDVAVAWQRDGAKLAVVADVPAGMSLEVSGPGAEGDVVGRGHHEFRLDLA
ncbi:family 78 glycoside hydrolase catalytic domain [Actinoplanes sp. NPDC051411]|uniref:family 78 glycoside hydrolase catalytic domain n=1 Tax=Actinoplanes sp. NPDC051411 TaxID=3155522 RepID=UPI003446590C